MNCLHGICIIRAKQGIKSSTTEALRKFYEKDNYTLLKREDTFNDLITLAHFWEDVINQDKDRSHNEFCAAYLY